MTSFLITKTIQAESFQTYKSFSWWTVSSFVNITKLEQTFVDKAIEFDAYIKNQDPSLLDKKTKQLGGHDWRDIKPQETVDQSNAYRSNDLNEDSKFLTYVIKSVHPPYHFKLVLKPSGSLKDEYGIQINDPKKVDALILYLEEELKAEELKVYYHQGEGRELIHLIFTFSNKKDALAYHNYISDNSNYSGYKYPTLYRYFLRDGKSSSISSKQNKHLLIAQRSTWRAIVFWRKLRTMICLT